MFERLYQIKAYYKNVEVNIKDKRRKGMLII